MSLVGPEAFRPTRAVPPLGRGKIQVWGVELDLSPDRVAELRALLEPDEKKRADRFHFDRHRRRFTVRRGRLRQLLGGYLGVDPAAVRLVLGDKGKPSLDPRLDDPADPLLFNLSDSGDLAVYAFARGLETGIDVEVLRPMRDALRIAEGHFAPEEQAVLRAVAEEKRDEAFFCCWTRKEAYIKAIGEGLSEPLDNFRVDFFPPEPARFRHIGKSAREAERWSLHHFVPFAGSVAALAYRGTGFALSYRKWKAR